MMEWKTTNVEKILGRPVEVDLDRLSASLFISSPFVFNWCNGFLFSYGQRRDHFFDAKDHMLVTIDLIYNVEYLKLRKHYRFVALDLDTLKIEFIDGMNEKTNVVYFPVEKSEDCFHRRIYDIIYEEGDELDESKIYS